MNTTDRTDTADRGSELSAGLGPRWWDCATHGRGRANAWGCHECVREMREEIKRLRAALTKIEAGLCIDPRTVAHDALGPNVALSGQRR